MSILFIGEKSNHFSNHPHFWMDKNEQQAIVNQKKITQQQYRQDLLQQMKQHNEKKKKEKQRQREIDMQRERIFNEKLAQYHSAFHSQDQLSSNNQKSINDEINIAPFSLKSTHKQQASALPRLEPSANLNKYRFKDQIKEQKNICEFPCSRPNSLKMKTEHLYESNRDLFDNNKRMNSPQIRHKQMQQQLNTKISEVYNLIAKSVKTLNQTQQLQKIGQKMSPIKLHLQQKYKMRYSSPNNPEQNQNFYKLPKISQKFRVKQNLKDSEANWREWYAKQKLHELQNLQQSELTKNHQKYGIVKNVSNISSFQHQIL